MVDGPMSKARRQRKAMRAELRMRMLVRPKSNTIADLEVQVEYWQSRYFACMAGAQALVEHIEAMELVLAQLVTDEHQAKGATP